MAALGAAAAFAPASASAGFTTPPPGSCFGNLVDSFGGNWDYTSGGYIDDGSIDGGSRSDAFDSFPPVGLSTDNGANWTGYSNPDSSACTLEDNDREVVYPADTTSIPGLSISRKIYVPDTGLAFARFLTALTNTGTDPQTLSIDLGGGANDLGSLGSDSGTRVATSSSGDTSMASSDNWATTWDGYVDGTTGDQNGDPALAHNWQNGSADVTTYDHADDVSQSADLLTWRFDGVTIQPGQTVIYMNTEAMRSNNAQTADVAKALDAEPAELYAAMTADEVAAVRNWCKNDCDADGVANGQDNCPSAANADQADMDGDGKGDTCDSDIDGDGLSNSTEDEVGTNPRSVDSDGDGVGDKADQCPVKAGSGADGCPTAQVAQQPTDATAPNAQIVSVAGANDLGDLLNGFTVTLTCDEACEARVRALGRMPTGSAVFSITGGFNRVLGRTYSPFKAGTQQVRVRPCERKPGGPQSQACLKRLKKAGSAKRSFIVKVYVLASDRAGNTKETSKLIRVKRG